MRQAGMTVSAYLSAAHEAIDDQFGKDHAVKNPQLVAAFIAACAQDFDTAIKAQSADELRQSLGNSLTTAIQEIVEALRDR